MINLEAILLTEFKNKTRPEAVEYLRKYISENGFKAGSRLPSERVLTSQLGITRNNLRKALDDLEREGRIWRHVGKGTFITANETDLDQLMDSPVALGKQLTPVKMMRARLAIEPAIAKEAAINASGEALSRMNLAMERAHSAPDWKLYEDQDDEFHRIIAEASDNLLLLSIFDQLNMVRRAVAWGNVKRQTIKPSRTHTSFAEHENIARAIEQRNPNDAYEAMRKHLRSVSGRLFEEI